MGRRVIDTSGYLPREVRASAGLLADSAEHYTFVSSISVYEDFGRTGLDEEAPVLAPPDPEPGELDMELYGGLKVGCERAAEAAMLGEGPRGAPRPDRWSARLSAAVRDRPGHTRTGDGEAGSRNRCGHLAEAGARVASGVAGCHPVGVGLESAGTV